MSPEHLQFVVTMAIPRTAAFTSQRKMITVSLVVGLLLVCLAADAVEIASSIVASARKTSHSSATSRRRQQRFLRSRRVQDPMNNNDGDIGILPDEASFDKQEADEANFEEQEGKGGQNNSPAGAYGSESAPGLDIDPSVLQSGILGILPVPLPEDHNESSQVETSAAADAPSEESVAQEENAADAPSEESVAQEETGQPVRDTYSPPLPVFSTPLETQEEANSEGNGDPPPGASESENIVNQIAPAPPARHSTFPEGEPEGNGGRGNALPAGNGSEGGNGSDQNHNEGVGDSGRIDNNEDYAGTIPVVTDDKILEEIQQEERKVRTIGGFGIFLAMVAMIFTAWQMSDNPDGIYAAMCRLVITIIGLVMRILLSPCRSCIGGSHGSRNYAGHMPVSTMDYGYRDPALELS